MSRRALRVTPSKIGLLTTSPRRSSSLPYLYRHAATAPATSIIRTTFTGARAAATTAPEARFSPGADPLATAGRLQPLLRPAGGRWALTPSGEGLERAFKFKTFAKTWDFMTAVALRCKVHNHHPEWSNAYNTTFIRWTTHSPRGLSALDVDLAIACDALARDFGELDPEPAPEPESESAAASCALGDLATRAAGSGDCCAPKK